MAITRTENNSLGILIRILLIKRWYDYYTVKLQLVYNDFKEIFNPFFKQIAI